MPKSKETRPLMELVEELRRGARNIPPEESDCPEALLVREYADGSRSYILGDCLPKTEKERQERNRRVAKVCADIYLANADTTG